MRNLLKLDNEVRLGLVGPLVAFTFETKFTLRAHTRFDLDVFLADCHLLCFPIAQDDHSFEINFFSATIVKFFKCTFNSNRQVLKLSGKCTHHGITSSFYSSYLITRLVQSNGERISGTKESLENLKSVSLELVATFKANLFGWYTIFQLFFTILIINFLKFRSREDLIRLTDL